MIVGFCGASSTGKTTLLHALMSTGAFRNYIHAYKHVDARSILDSMGHRSMDLMDPPQLRAFQIEYIRQKIANEEGQDGFCSDRTFIDIAAYWICRDAVDLRGPLKEDVIKTCRQMAERYTLHVFLPFGLLRFQSDGYRSENMELHRTISNCMKSLLMEWGLRWIEVNSTDLENRTQQVLNAL